MAPFSQYSKISKFYHKPTNCLLKRKKGHMVEKRTITDFFTVKKKSKLNEVKKANVEDKEADIEIKKTDIEINKTDTRVENNPKVSSDEFDKGRFIESLTEEQKKLLALELDTMDISWLALLHKEIIKPYFLNLKRFLMQEWQGSVPIFPPAEDIYSWTRLTQFQNVKVLIIGQDPYHNFNQAHGLAFSVLDPKTRVPPSLVNIYKGIKIDYPDFEVPKVGNLTPWARDGVLMLNTCLTVRAHNANSHAGRGWEQFTRAVVKTLIDKHSLDRGIVVVAWGSPALKMVNSVGHIDWHKNLLLKSVHPSPLSARRGFFDAHHFKLCNEWISEHLGKEEVIQWTKVGS